MNTCRKCQSRIHWDDNICPRCGTQQAEPDAKPSDSGVAEVWRFFRWRLILAGGILLAVLISGLTGVGGAWAAGLAGAVVGVLWWLTLRLSSKYGYQHEGFSYLQFYATRRPKEVAQKKADARSRKRLYHAFLKEDPSRADMASKDRHNAFRVWMESRP
jgi:hypothetical protein